MTKSSTSEHLYLVDLDRTLLDVDTSMKIFEKTCTRLGFDASLILDARHEIEAKGQSFQALEMLKEMYPTEILQRFKVLYIDIAHSTHDFMFSDGKRLLERFQESSKPFVLMTYGHEDWQKLKIQGAGLLQLPAIVTNKKEKGKLITSWFDLNKKYFAVPGHGLYETLTLVDDKIVSFESLPDSCRGYYIKRGADDTKAVLAENITQISSLDEVE